jgi:hypothetical protein
MASYNNFGEEFGGFAMRITSFVKILGVTLAFVSAAALPWSVPAASAAATKHAMKLPSGACAVEKKATNAGAICSFQCNAQTNWCAQQFCANGTLVQVLPCFGPLCTPKCTG